MVVYVCDKCQSYESERKSNFERHTKGCGKDKGPKTIICDKCNIYETTKLATLKDIPRVVGKTRVQRLSCVTSVTCMRQQNLQT